MNTEESPTNKAAAKLKALNDGAVHTREAKVLLSVEDAADVLAYIAELEAKVSKHLQEVPLEVGDVVREVGQEELTGEIIEIKANPHMTTYLVKLYAPSVYYESIIYYRSEIEFIERAK